MPKTSLPREAVEAFLRREMPGSAGTVQPLVEGEEAQAFAFSQSGQAYVIRITRSAAGFHKDAYAYRHFCSSALPIPAVHRIGQIDAEHTYCISDLAPGMTLQALPAEALPESLAPTLEVWAAIGAVDVTKTSGFGDFDHLGRGEFASWQDYLRAVLNQPSEAWESRGTMLDHGLIGEVTAVLEATIPRCPEVRQLVHGDFGSNNVLAQGARITAVLDWDNAKYGDGLFDLAGAYYWRPWLACMDALAAYCEQRLGGLPGYHERLICYQARVGLAEIFENAAAGNMEWVQWHQRRCAVLLRGA
jgi:hygromycin-B 4-O-kinase